MLTVRDPFSLQNATANDSSSANVSLAATGNADMTLPAEHPGHQPTASAVADDPLYRPLEAAAVLRLSVSALAKLRMEPGRGPRFIRLSANRVAYRRSALNAWLAERERGSTHDDLERS